MANTTTLYDIPYMVKHSHKVKPSFAGKVKPCHASRKEDLHIWLKPQNSQSYSPSMSS